MHGFLGTHHGIHDWVQQREIDDAHRTASRARSRAQELEVAVDRLALTAQAMWELLRDRTGLTEDDLVRKIEEVDLRDGKLDGRIGKTMGTCPSCDRPNSSRRSACLYCGEPIEPTSAF